jgi:hypothetical protein
MTTCSLALPISLVREHVNRVQQSHNLRVDAGTMYSAPSASGARAKSGQERSDTEAIIQVPISS